MENEPQKEDAYQGNEGVPQQNTSYESAPVTEQAPDIMPEPAREKSYGPIIGIVIIVILIIFAGFYFWGSSLEGDKTDTPTEQIDGSATTGDVSVEVGEVLSESTELDDLEADLLGTDLDNLDAEFSDLDAELNF